MPDLSAMISACAIEAGTPVGRDINRLFLGFVSREFGQDAFRVERVDRLPQHATRESRDRRTSEQEQS